MSKKINKIKTKKLAKNLNNKNKKILYINPNVEENYQKRKKIYK